MYLPYRTVGALILLCKKSAVQGLLQKQEFINFTGLRLQINEDILDSSTSLDELQQYFTKYAWAAIEKKVNLHTNAHTHTTHKQTYHI